MRRTVETVQELRSSEDVRVGDPRQQYLVKRHRPKALGTLVVLSGEDSQVYTETAWSICNHSKGPIDSSSSAKGLYARSRSAVPSQMTFARGSCRVFFVVDRPCLTNLAYFNCSSRTLRPVTDCSLLPAQIPFNDQLQAADHPLRAP